LRNNIKRTILTNPECGYLANLLKKKLEKKQNSTLTQDDDEGDNYTELFN